MKWMKQTRLRLSNNKQTKRAFHRWSEDRGRIEEGMKARLPPPFIHSSFTAHHHLLLLITPINQRDQAERRPLSAITHTHSMAFVLVGFWSSWSLNSLSFVFLSLSLSQGWSSEPPVWLSRLSALITTHTHLRREILMKLSPIWNRAAV